MTIDYSFLSGFKDFRITNMKKVLTFRSLLQQYFFAIIEKFLFRRTLRHLTFIMGGPVFFQTVRAACQLHLFDYLAQKPGQNLATIAQSLQIDEQAARTLLMGCTALKLLKKKGERYFNRAISNIFLRKDSLRSTVPIIEMVHHIIYPSIWHYHEALLHNSPIGLQVFEGEGSTLYARLAHNRTLEDVFHKGMQAKSKMTNPQFVSALDFSKFKKILDVGGGNGENMIQVAKKYKSVQASVLDYQTVAEKANEQIKKAGLSDRVNAIGCNILEDVFPLGYDCITFCHFTPIWSEVINKKLLQKAYKALEPGGCVCIYAPFMHDDETGPLGSAILSPYFLCTVGGHGRHYSKKETVDWLKSVGFNNISKRAFPRNEGVIIGFKSFNNR